MHTGSSSMEPHDFEIINTSETPSSVPDNPTPTPATEDARSIKDLFEQHTEPSMIQTVAKTCIFLCLPHQIMWSVATAIFVALCQPTPNEDTPLDQLVFKQITLHTEDRLNRTRKRLEWVDTELPSIAEKYNKEISRAFDQVKASRNSVVVTRTSQIALFAVGAPVLFSVFLASVRWIRAPLWTWLALAYFVGKRRGRRSIDNRRPSTWDRLRNCRT